MNKHFFTGAFALGAAALLWIAIGFLGHNGLALCVTLVIASVYGYGAWELQRFRQNTCRLAAALDALPSALNALEDWLTLLPAGLQNPVRLRVESGTSSLPGPALTPYLVGLLVMLGMLGTFLGMVATLNGAVFALDGSSDLGAIRAAFAAPIKGLGLAFGTSVAGVASSAMLGLMSALARRERLQVLQTLDLHIAGPLRGFSHRHQRQQTYLALQLQSQALPAVVAQLQAMAVQMGQMQQQLNERLLGNQQSFHADVKSVYAELARNVDISLRESLLHSAQAAADSIRPVLESALAALAQEARQMQDRMVSSTQTQLATVTTTMGQRSEALLQAIADAYAALQTDQARVDGQRLQQWLASLQTVADQSQTSSATLLAQITQLLAASEELVHVRIASESTWTAEHGERLAQLGRLLQSELSALRKEEAAHAAAAVERLGQLESTVTLHLGTLGKALEQPISRLIETAAEAPRAAAEVIGKLRQEVSNSAARDNQLLEERARILATLNGLLDSIHHASAEQRQVIDTLVSASAMALQDASTGFAQQVGSETGKLADLAAQVGSSAVDVAALGETFGFAVRSFNAANENLIAHLQRIETAMDKSLTRSDEQLAYYVAQAREVIDLCMLSQKQVMESLTALPAQRPSVPEQAN